MASLNALIILTADFPQELLSGVIVLCNARVANTMIMPMLGGATGPIAFGKRTNISFPQAGGVEAITVPYASSKNRGIRTPPSIVSVLLGLKVVFGARTSEPLQFPLGGPGESGVQVKIWRHANHIFTVTLAFSVFESACQGLQYLPARKKLQLPGEIGVAAPDELEDDTRVHVA